MDIDSLITEWLLEYSFYCCWNQINEKLTANKQKFNRNFIFGVLALPHDTDKLNRLNYLTWLLCYLLDGAAFEDDEEQTITPLEKALLCYINENVHNFTELTALIKKQAVLVCCRSGQFNNAQFVFDRIFSTPESDQEKEMMPVLQEAISAEKKTHSVIRQNSYSKFIKNVVHILESLPETKNVPFLVKRAESVINNVHEDDDEGQMKSNFCESTVNMREALKLYKNLKDQELEDLPQDRLKDIRSNKDKYLKRAPRGVLQEPANKKKTKGPSQKEPQSESDPSDYEYEDIPGTDTQQELPYSGGGDNVQSSSNRKGKENYTPRKRLKRGYNSLCNAVDERITSLNSLMSSSSSSEEEDDSDLLTDGELPRLPTPRVVNKDLAPQSRRERRQVQRSPSPTLTYRKRRPWTEEEEEGLWLGVKALGVGSWAKIKEQFALDTRTSVDIKDKWRNINKDKSMLKRLSKKYGKIQH